MSATQSNGKTIPVEDLLPKTNAIRVTLNISMPFSPAFPNPIIKAANKIKVHSGVEYNEKMSMKIE